MRFTKQQGFTITFAIGAMLAGAACGDAASPQQSQSIDEFGATASQLGVAVPTCSTAGSSGYTASTKTLALALVDTVSNTIVVSAPGGIVKVNGYSCVSTAGTPLTTTTVTKITIAGTPHADKVILDTLAGGFGSIVASTGGGITVSDDPAPISGSDAIMLRGSANADSWTMGASGAGDVFAEISGDKVADVRAVGFEQASISLGASNDSFSGNGSSTISAVRLASGVTSLLAVPATFPMTIYGGDGNDTLQGGDGNDTLYGGPGDDTFKTAAAADGADKYFGDTDSALAVPLGDTIDYSARTVAITVDIGPSSLAADGDDGDAAAAEHDDVNYTVENITGGQFDDTLTGSDKSNYIKGGLGDDKIAGGVAGTCSSDKDTLQGDDGNDTFNMTATSDCGDVVLGGNGKDVVDYSARSQILTITLDLNANDGESGENDNIKDAEVILGGSNDDSITGGALDDELHGGAGNDVISGLAGNDVLVGDDGNDELDGGLGDDTFDEGLVDAYPAGNATLKKGKGDDILNGGPGTNTADYSGRTTALTVTLCLDANLTGAPASAAPECTDADGDPAVGTVENDNIVNCSVFYGGSGADHITGSTGDDSLYGGTGNNVLDGNLGDDICLNDAVPTVAPVNCEVF